MLAHADFQRALALALGEFAPAWTIVGDCSPVDHFDASHWGSGPLSFQVTLRHRVTGHLKVLGRRVSYEPGASVHPAVALPLVGAYRHGNSEPIRRYFEEIGVAAASTSEAADFFQRSTTVPSPAASRFEPRDPVSTRVAVATSISAPGAASTISAPTAASAVGGDDQPEADAGGPAQRTSRPWRVITSSAPRRTLPPPAADRARRPHGSPTVEARKPMLGRLRRELEIWYWRRGAWGKEKPHARD